TVKIHDGAGEDKSVMENDPHVCTFHIHGFNFDAGATGTWQIKAWEPTGDNSTVVAGDGWGPASASGEWREPKTGAMSLPDGHYKLFVKQVTPPAPGGDKQKVFWVECAQRAGAAAEQARSELTAAITNAQSVSGQLATTIGVAQALVGNLTGAAQVALQAAINAAVTAQGNLTAP